MQNNSLYYLSYCYPHTVPIVRASLWVIVSWWVLGCYYSRLVLLILAMWEALC